MLLLPLLGSSVKFFLSERRRVRKPTEAGHISCYHWHEPTFFNHRGKIHGLGGMQQKETDIRRERERERKDEME